MSTYEEQIINTSDHEDFGDEGSESELEEVTTNILWMDAEMGPLLALKEKWVNATKKEEKGLLEEGMRKLGELG